MTNWKQPKVYAVQHKDEEIRLKSRSGGIFTALSDYVLENNGVVYGCVLNQDFQAIHARANNQADRNLMRGSKYIQSHMGDTFRFVKCDLESGYKVLFSGTSCQIAGLRSYLGRDYENLISVDIICHGVPSPKVWKSYLAWQEALNDSKIQAVDFRNKKDFGWRAHVETICFKSGRKINSKVYTTLFYGHSILRPCCYNCPFKSIMHPGDITIGDYWGIEKAEPEFDDNKGVSLVLINNEKGKSFFNIVEDKIIAKETRIEDCIQPPLQAPYSRPKHRNLFWKEYNNKPFEVIVRKYGGTGIVSRVIRVVKRIKKKVIKK